MRYPLMRNNILREDLDAVIQYLQQDDPILTNGPYVRAFEEEWSKWLGVKYSVFVNSGSSANLLTMAILKIRYPEGGEVIVPTLTWTSDISSVLQNGFTPIFVDTDPHSLSMNNKQVLSKITSNTRAVFLTHAQGFDGLTDELINFLELKNIPLIEDACESHGASHNNQKVGSIGWISNFSFFYAHHMSTIEGGMVCTNDEEVYQQLRMLRSHGMVREANNPKIHQVYKDENPELNPRSVAVAGNYNQMRFWSTDFIIKEFDKLIQMGVKTIRIVDEMFLLNPKYYIPLCEKLAERNKNDNLRMWAWRLII